MRRRLSAPSSACSSLLVFWLAMLQAGGARAQAANGEAVALKPSPELKEAYPPEAASEQPTFVLGNRMEVRPDLLMKVEGAAELRRNTMVIKADQLNYEPPTDRAVATGNVLINRSGNVYEGTELDLKVDAFEGVFKQPRYSFLKNGGHGEARQLDFIDDKHFVAHDATFTTCKADGPDWVPDWILKASKVKFDYEEETGQTESGSLQFKGVPILPIPGISFPLSDKRKSGFLPPTVEIDKLSGFGLTVPYYWNIAPQRDATFFPTLMTRRGVDLGAEFRYLEPEYSGVLRGSIMPNDKLRDRDRWGYSALHNGTLPWRFGSASPVWVNLNLNRVSDDNYWRDFPRSTGSLTQRLLANDASMGWSYGNWSTYLRALRWQTLQDVDAPIVPPYDRWPQLAANYSRPNVALGLDVGLSLDYTHFVSDRRFTGQPNAQRSMAIASISRSWRAPGWFVVPRVQLHTTAYQFDSPLATGASSFNRTVPTFSLDSGLIYERETKLWNRNLTQTLEPRLFYVYTPWRNQNILPNYDSALNDFNFATIYTENAFGGHDRISDNNLLTLGVTSRLLDANDGGELMRFDLAQRLRFKSQQVTLPGVTPDTDRFSDLLLGANVNWNSRWSFSSTVQVDPQEHRSVRSTVGARYNPGSYRVVSAAYRLQRGISEQIDVGWQWPLSKPWASSGTSSVPSGRWYSVGRMNYSMTEKKLVDSVVGFEYDAGCWLGRVVVESLQRSTASTNTRILFQLEFVGLSRLGSNAFETLKQNIPRYQHLREQVVAPSRFSKYD